MIFPFSFLTTHWQADFNATEAIGAPKAGPGMLSELRFWAAREEQVSSIFEQLQAPRIRQVLEFLDRARSTYNAPFAALCREVASAMAEAKDNSTFPFIFQYSI